MNGVMRTSARPKRTKWQLFCLVISGLLGDVCVRAVYFELDAQLVQAQGLKNRFTAALPRETIFIPRGDILSRDACHLNSYEKN